MADLRDALHAAAPDPRGGVSRDGLAARARRRRRARLAVTAVATTVTVIVAVVAVIALAGRDEPSTVTSGPDRTSSSTSNPTSVPPPPDAGGELWTVQVVSASTVFAAGPGRILRSDDGGRTWREMSIDCSSCPGNLLFAHIDMLDASTGWAASSLGLFATTDGEHWVERPTGLPHEPAIVHFASRQLGWLVAAPWGAGEYIGLHDAIVARTGDGGATWHRLDDVPPDVQSVCFTGVDDGWLATRDAVYRSGDSGGAPWRRTFRSPLTPTPGQGVAELQCAAPGGAWVQFQPGARRYGLYSTSDRGAHWKIAFEVPVGSRGPAPAPSTFSAIDPSTAVVIGGPSASGDLTTSVVRDGKVAGRVVNARLGAAFTPIAASFSDEQHGVVVGDVVGGGLGILATADGGRSWTEGAVGTTPTPTTETQSSESTTSSPTTIAATAVTPCTASSMRIESVTGISPPTGRNPYAIELVNAGRAECSIDGYPSLTLRDADGAVLPFGEHHGRGMVVSAATPLLSVLEPGAAVYAVIDKYRCDDPGSVPARTAELALPDGGGSLTLPSGGPAGPYPSASGPSPYQYCGSGDPGSTIDVSPFGSPLSDLVGK